MGVAASCHELHMEDKPTENTGWQRVIRVAKYEQPPPGFHAALRNKIRSRIVDLEIEQARPWWHRFAKPITGRPALIWANVVTAVGLGFVGLSLFEASKNPPLPTNRKNDFQLTKSGLDLGSPATPVSFQPSQLGVITQMFVIPIRFGLAATPTDSTNPLPAGLFQVPSSQGFQVSFRTDSGN